MISNILVLSLFVASVFGGSTIINDGLYILETRVSLSGDSIRVKITAEGNGYIGFGISPSGTMTGADIVIAGYDESVAKGYLDDYHGVGNMSPVLDDIKNVDLITAVENTTHTVIEFQRALNTGDTAHDIPITNQEQTIIWSIGPSDNLEYHNAVRGVAQVNLMAA